MSNSPESIEDRIVVEDELDCKIKWSVEESRMGGYRINFVLKTGLTEGYSQSIDVTPREMEMMGMEAIEVKMKRQPAHVFQKVVDEFMFKDDDG